MGIPLVRLDESSLLKSVSKMTGLSDFGDDSARQGLRVLLSALEEETHLSLMGRLVARQSILRLLINRFEMIETHKLHPDIAKGDIRRPVFIIGMPRTGTSILHELIAQDPSVRTPLSWEVERSLPPPEPETCDTDPRIAVMEKQFSRVYRLIPEFQKMHPLGALLPQECVAIMAHDFASLLFQSFYHVPSYAAWLQNEADISHAYASHRRHLQLLQWRFPVKRWVLKSPGHLWSLEALLAEYPDACLLACSLAHHGTSNPSLARIQIVQSAFRPFPEDIEINMCRQCANPQCVKTCPTGAFHIDSGIGNVRAIDEALCDGCGDCVTACPFTPCRVTWNCLTNTAMKCDLCAHARYCCGTLRN